MSVGGTPQVTEVQVGLPALSAALHAGQYRRVLVLTGPSRRHVDRVLPLLSPRQVHVFDGARVHVPAETVSAAERVVTEFSPDLLLSIGGGAATGLGKLLRLEHGGGFIVLPTTFSGSEMTGIWGRSVDGHKRTGRDPRVRPDLVVHDPMLVAGLPRGLATRSAFNALAHPVSALSTGALDDALRALALEAIARGWAPLGELAHPEGSADARFLMLRAAALCGRVIDAAPLGVHHRVAHLLGARFGLDHSSVHSILLPHSVAALRSDAGAYAALCEAVDHDAPAAALHGTLSMAGCPVHLGAIGVGADDLRACQSELAALGPQAVALAHAAGNPAPPT